MTSIENTKDKPDDVTNNPCVPITHTACIYLYMMCIGMCTSIFGPTLVHVSLLYDVTLADMSNVIMTNNIANLIGSFGAGVLFDRFNANLQESITVLLMGLTIAFAPFATSFYSYQFLMATECFCQGYLYSAIPGQIYELWDASRFKGSILQGCYSVWTLGLFLTPLLSIPFLSDLSEHCLDLAEGKTAERAKDVINRDMNKTSATSAQEEVSDWTMTSTCSDDVIDVQNAYVTVGCFSIVVAIICFIVFLVNRPSLRKKTFSDVTISTNYEAVKKNAQSSSAVLPKPKRYVLLCLMSLFCAFVIYFSYLPTHFINTFAMQGLEWPVGHGAVMTSVFTGLGGAGRVLSVPLAYFASPGLMIISMLAASTASFVLMCCITFLPDFMVWCSFGLAGLSSSALCTFNILWIGQHIPVTSATGSLFLISGSVGAITGSWILGRLMIVNHMWLIYVCLIACLIDFLLFVAMKIVAGCKAKCVISILSDENTPIIGLDRPGCDQVMTVNTDQVIDSLKNDFDIISDRSSVI